MTVVLNLFLMEFHLEVLYCCRVQPGSKQAQIDQISICSIVEHANELPTKNIAQLNARAVSRSFFAKITSDNKNAASD